MCTRRAVYCSGLSLNWQWLCTVGDNTSLRVCIYKLSVGKPECKMSFLFLKFNYWLLLTYVLLIIAVINYSSGNKLRFTDSVIIDICFWFNFNSRFLGVAVIPFGRQVIHFILRCKHPYSCYFLGLVLKRESGIYVILAVTHLRNHNNYLRIKWRT